MLRNSTKNDCINLYWHHKPFKITFKSDSYLVSISRRGLVTPSTLFFPISISKKQLSIYLLFRMSLTCGYKNLYFHPYTFDERKKSFSYLTSLSRRGTAKITEKGRNDLYFNSFTFNMSHKSFSFLTALLAISIWQKQW